MYVHTAQGVLISPSPDREGNKRQTSGFIQHTPHEVQWHFLVLCSNFCKPLKKKNSEGCPPNQVSAAAVTNG